MYMSNRLTLSHPPLQAQAEERTGNGSAKLHFARERLFPTLLQKSIHSSQCEHSLVTIRCFLTALTPHRQQQEAAGTPSSTPAAAGTSGDSDPQPEQRNNSRWTAAGEYNRKQSFRIELFMASLRMRKEQSKKRRAIYEADVADTERRLQWLAEYAESKEAEKRADQYGEKLKELVVLLHQKVWWQIESLAPELATCPEEFFEWEFCGCQPYLKALRDAVSCVGMSMVDYGELVRAYDNRDDSDMYFDPTAAAVCERQGNSRW